MGCPKDRSGESSLCVDDHPVCCGKGTRGGLGTVLGLALPLLKKVGKEKYQQFLGDFFENYQWHEDLFAMQGLLYVPFGGWFTYHPHSLQMVVDNLLPSENHLIIEFVCFICFTSNPSHTWSLTENTE